MRWRWRTISRISARVSLVTPLLFLQICVVFDFSCSLGQSCGLLLMTADEVTADIEEDMHLFDGLGLTVHAQKSVLQPVQGIEYKQTQAAMMHHL